MQNLFLAAPLLTFVTFIAGNALQAQTVTVSPSGYVTAGPGATVQYTATVSGTTGSTAVIWLVADVVGGNSTIGTISPTGLYTAPANIPSYTSEGIKAKLASNTKISGSQAITLLMAGPQITSVTPNPLPSGTVNITITGTGFLPGVVVQDGGVELSTGAVTPTTITSSIYHPASATSTTFSARNPLSAFGNTVTVPIGSAPVISPALATVTLAGAEHFTAPGATAWSAVYGTVGSSGLYTAPSVMPASGTDTVTASNAIGSSVAHITLKAIGAPVISPSTVSVVLSKTQQFTAQGATSWTAVSGTVTSSGLYTAPSAMPSTGTDSVTASNSAGQSTAQITLQTNLAPVISPATVSVTLTQTQQFTAPGATSWTAVSGKVTSTGLYTAPSSMPASGVDTVTAKNAAGSSAASVTLIGNVPPGAISPASATVMLSATQQFKSTGAASWSAVSGTVTSAGLYTAPPAMPPAGTDTITALNSAGQVIATITLVTNVPPVVSSTGTSPLPLGIFSTTVTGSGFTAQSLAQLNGAALSTTYVNATTLNITGFAGPASSANLTVSNGTLVSAPLVVPVGVQAPVVSVSAARRFLEQAAFGPTPADAANVQTIGFEAWINQQLALPVISNYNAITGDQGGMPNAFLTNAVTNSDQLRQRVAFALSEIFTISITKVIWNGDMIPYEQMLINDAFTNYRKILGDVTLSPGMGEYLDMANNAKANPAAGTAANENFAREVMQLFSLGDVLLSQDGTVQVDASGIPLPTYLQPNISELARVFTGWTYVNPGGQPNWPSYINSSGPMVPYTAMHDFGSKTLLNGYVAAANLTPLQDLNGALDNIAAHQNVAPFISRQLIQHLVKSNPTPAYVKRVAQAFSQSNGDMPTVITAILLDAEARANDEGGNDLSADGHLQEPALFLPGLVRAFNGQMTYANYYASNLAGLGQDIYNPASVFSYFAPGYSVPGTGLLGPEFQIDNPNAAILRENLVAELFSQYSNPVQTYGPGTAVDLTSFLPLAATPSVLVNALDLTLTHGTMPAAMKQIISSAVTQDQSYGALKQVESACYLILTSSYYNVWH
jgi:Protein of unknown function (DUF1800)